MIRSVLLMATSGLMLFSKEFVNAVAQPRLIGSLLTALTEFSGVATGMPVAYIELTTVAVTIVTNDVAKVFCALFHDKSDGPEFGKLISGEVLHAFVEEYSSDLRAGVAGHNLRDFHGFHNRIADVIRNSVRPVLAQLQSQRGIYKALLVTEDSIISPNTEIDQLGVLANLQALTGLSTDIMTYVDDDCRHVMLEGSHGSRLFLWKVERSMLIIAVNRTTAVSKYRAVLQETIQVVERVCELMSNLHLVSR